MSDNSEFWKTIRMKLALDDFLISLAWRERVRGQLSRSSKEKIILLRYVLSVKMESWNIQESRTVRKDGMILMSATFADIEHNQTCIRMKTIHSGGLSDEGQDLT